MCLVQAPMAFQQDTTVIKYTAVYVERVGNQLNKWMPHDDSKVLMNASCSFRRATAEGIRIGWCTMISILVSVSTAVIACGLRYRCLVPYIHDLHWAIAMLPERIINQVKITISKTERFYMLTVHEHVGTSGRGPRIVFGSVRDWFSSNVLLNY